MNGFLNVSTGGALLKDYYPQQDARSLLMDALKKRRRKLSHSIMGQFNDEDLIESGQPTMTTKRTNE